MVDSSLFDLSGQKALVTGGAMGIGRASALALAMGGADVAIVDVDERVGAGTAASVRQMGRDAVFICCDVSRPEQIQPMIDAVVRRFGRLDIAVNNAGIYRHGPDETQSQEDWNQVIGLNLTGTWMCARAEMLQMARQVPTQGKIINIASIAASIACSNAAYDASKAGVVHMTKTLAVQWGNHNINVNSISPGYVISGMGSKSRSLDERRRIREITPLGHILRLEDLYGPVMFLASRASDYVTGQNLVVDGGHTLSTWLEPLARGTAPRVDTAAEVFEMNKDLDARGIEHDGDGIIHHDTNTHGND